VLSRLEWYVDMSTVISALTLQIYGRETWYFFFRKVHRSALQGGEVTYEWGGGKCVKKKLRNLSYSPNTLEEVERICGRHRRNKTCTQSHA
jgi:hypothetical protein